MYLPFLISTSFAVSLTVVTSGAAAGTGAGTGVAGMVWLGVDGSGTRRTSANEPAICRIDRSAVQKLHKLSSTSACSRISTCAHGVSPLIYAPHVSALSLPASVVRRGSSTGYQESSLSALAGCRAEVVRSKSELRAWHRCVRLQISGDSLEGFQSVSKHISNLKSSQTIRRTRRVYIVAHCLHCRAAFTLSGSLYS